MDIQNGIMMSKEENDQSLLKQRVKENLSETQGLPTIFPITYEMMEESEAKEAAVFQDMADNLKLWRTLSNREAMERIAMIHSQVERVMKK